MSSSLANMCNWSYFGWRPGHLKTRDRYIMTWYAHLRPIHWDVWDWGKNIVILRSVHPRCVIFMRPVWAREPWMDAEESSHSGTDSNCRCTSFINTISELEKKSFPSMLCFTIWVKRVQEPLGGFASELVLCGLHFSLLPWQQRLRSDSALPTTPLRTLYLGVRVRARQSYYC